MVNEQLSIQPVKPPLHWPALFQLIFSLLAAFVLIGAAVAVVASVAAQYFTHGAAATDPTELFMIAASLVFAGVLVLPSAWYAWKQIANPEGVTTPQPERHNLSLILTGMVIVLVGGALLLGNWASQNNRITWLLLPPLNIIATGLPALWVMYIGSRGLIPGAPRRRWGVFASGLILGPLIILILEMILLVIVGILAILWVMLNPTMANQLNGLLFRLQNAGSNLDTILQILVPFILNPGVMFLMLAFIAVLVPLLEEALKPIGVWFLVGQQIRPAQGFGYGVLSGAGFGLFENLGNTSGGAAGWALLASTRISTLLLHSFTAGLMGWALVSTWSEKRYLRLAITYVIAMIIHGLWNGLALVSLTSTLQGLPNVSIPPTLQQIGALSPIGIVILGVVVFLLFIGFNTVLRRGMPGQMTPPMPRDDQVLKTPEINPQSSSNDLAALPTTEIDNRSPSSPGDNPPPNQEPNP